MSEEEVNSGSFQAAIIHPGLLFNVCLSYSPVFGVLLLSGILTGAGKCFNLLPVKRWNADCLLCLFWPCIFILLCCGERSWLFRLQLLSFCELKSFSQSGY